MITRKISVQLRAFCAAGYALFLSCTPGTPVDPTCIGGECTAIIKPILQTNSFSFDIDENNLKFNTLPLKFTLLLRLLHGGITESQQYPGIIQGILSIISEIPIVTMK